MMVFIKRIAFRSRRMDVKNFIKASIMALGLVFAVNTNSFALVDAAVWGGYVFSGEQEDNSGADPKGGEYGIKGHYNTSVLPLLELGIGAYYQYSKIKFDILDSDEDMTRKTIGFDANLILSLPILHPYIRGTYSIWDDISYSGYNDTEKFKGYGIGAGLEFTVAPFIRIFGEYMYDYTEHDAYFKSHAANIGLKIDI